MKKIFATFGFLLVFSSLSAFAQATCENVFTTSLAQTNLAVQTSEVFGQKISYADLSPQKHYDILEIQPALENSLLVHMDPYGHVMLWYKGVRIDALGKPPFYVKGQIKHASVLMSGVVFAIHKLPENFEDTFVQFVNNFESRQSRTCVSNACGTLQELGLNEVTSRKFLSATAFYKHMIKLAGNPDGQVEVLALGVNPKQFSAGLWSTQKDVLARYGVPAFAILGMPALLVGIRLLH